MLTIPTGSDQYRIGIESNYTHNGMPSTELNTLTRVLNLMILWTFSVQSFAVDPELLIKKANIYYQIPTQLGDPRELALANVEALKLQSKKDIKVIIHGFLGSRTHKSIKPLANAYLANGIDNVFLADWQDAAGLDYPTSRLAVGKVAIFFGEMLSDFINKNSLDRAEVHVIGHSLGAHIAGGIGKYFNGTLGRVTGLDPALPLFTKHAIDSLHAKAALFVDVIHTDYPVFGDLTPRGSVDFYPNFGQTPQSGCEDVDLITASKFVFEAYSCSHNRAVILYAETIGLPHNFPALPCNLSDIKAHDLNGCLKNLQINASKLAQAIAELDETQVVYMGEKVSRSTTGFYYLETYDTPPYGMGVNTKFIL